MRPVFVSGSMGDLESIVRRWASPGKGRRRACHTPVQAVAGLTGSGRCSSAPRPRTPGLIPWRCAMTALLIGYARCSTDAQDLTAQRDGLTRLGVSGDRIYVDHGLTGTNRERPGRQCPWEWWALRVDPRCLLAAVDRGDGVIIRCRRE